jgi:short-subunit dehydrogenase
MASSSKTETVLVTGASSGIGLELAKRFAADGHRLVLVARRADLLDTLAQELAANFKTEVQVIAMDLARPDAAQALWDETARRGLQIDVLVNNAGFGLHGEFADMPLARCTEMIQLNVTTLMALCHLAIPGMKQRGHGRIVNLSSLAGMQAAPMFTVYAATKAFVLLFSQALREEVAKDGIEVVAVCPGITESGFHEVARHSGTPMMRLMGGLKPMVDETYRGIQANRGMIVPGWINKLLPQLLRISPRGLSSKVTGWLMGR